MATAEQSNEPIRDYASPATWGDVERVRLSLEAQLAEFRADVDARFARMEMQFETKLAQMETRLTRLMLGVGAGTVAVLGVLMGVLEAVR